MNRRHGGVVVLLAIVALTGCAPIVAGSSTEPSEATTVTAEVVAVVDGDTIDVATGDGTARVRLIGIDTPEIGRGGEASECYAEEARTFLDQLLYGHEVELVGDITQADADRFGRLLRHVYVNGQSATELAIAAGTGYEYTYITAYEGQAGYRAAEDAAAASSAGLWGACS